MTADTQDTTDGMGDNQAVHIEQGDAVGLMLAAARRAADGTVLR